MQSKCSNKITEILDLHPRPLVKLLDSPYILDRILTLLHEKALMIFISEFQGKNNFYSSINTSWTIEYIDK